MPIVWCSSASRQGAGTPGCLRTNSCRGRAWVGDLTSFCWLLFVCLFVFKSPLPVSRSMQTQEEEPASLGGTCCQPFPLLTSLLTFPHRSCSLEDAYQDHSILAAGIPFWQFNEIFECCYRIYWLCPFPFSSSALREQVTHGFASSWAWVLVEVVEKMNIYYQFTWSVCSFMVILCLN